MTHAEHYTALANDAARMAAEADAKALAARVAGRFGRARDYAIDAQIEREAEAGFRARAAEHMPMVA